MTPTDLTGYKIPLYINQFDIKEFDIVSVGLSFDSNKPTHKLWSIVLEYSSYKVSADISLDIITRDCKVTVKSDNFYEYQSINDVFIESISSWSGLKSLLIDLHSCAIGISGGVTYFATNGLPRMIINSRGNVGIGNIMPSYHLNILN